MSWWGSHEIKQCSSRFLLARYYPLTTIPKASSKHPAGFASVSNSYTWPYVFLHKIVNKFGRSFVADRFNSWSWACSTTFSGVGAPESVRP